MARQAPAAILHDPKTPSIHDRNRQTQPRLERLRSVLRSGVTAAFFVHLAFLFLFLALEIWVLVAFNVFSLVVYALSTKLMAEPKRLPTVLVLAGVEVVLHATIASRIVGWESGFHYYVMALPTLIFLDARLSNRIKVSLTGVLILLYLGISLWTRTVAPLQPLDPAIVHMLNGFNISLTLVMLAMVLNVHSHSIERSEHQLQTLAETDRLTGLPNRRGLLNLIEGLYTPTAQMHTTPAVILIDIDHFKSINDHYGHSHGDSVLRAISQSMQAQIRDQDTLARWGGEEFLLLLHDTDLTLAFSVAERIREAVTPLTFEAEGQTFNVTITSGIALWEQDEPFEGCIQRADEALYNGKEGGRNRSVAHQDGRLHQPA